MFALIHIHNAEAWTAAGTWTTCLVLLATLLYVAQQVREARELRREQFRPWVTASFHFRSNIAFVAIKNLGTTAARNVRVRFEPELVTTRSAGIGKVAMLTEQTPVLVPGDERLLLLDRVPDRLNSDLPKRHTAHIEYSDHRGRDLPSEQFVIDFGLLDGARLPTRACTTSSKRLTRFVSGLYRGGSRRQRLWARQGCSTR